MLEIAGLSFLGLGAGSAVGGVGSDDEQRKKYAADRALGHSGAGTGDFSDRSCLQSAW